MEDDQNNKIEFTTDNHVKIYIDNVLETNDTYSISDSCDGVSGSNGGLYLQVTDSEDGTVDCSIINGINANNSNVLSLLGSNGQLTVYRR
jgi:hypothetical protein